MFAGFATFIGVVNTDRFFAPVSAPVTQVSAAVCNRYRLFCVCGTPKPSTIVFEIHASANTAWPSLDCANCEIVLVFVLGAVMRCTLPFLLKLTYRLPSGPITAHSG